MEMGLQTRNQEVHSLVDPPADDGVLLPDAKGAKDTYFLVRNLWQDYCLFPFLFFPLSSLLFFYFTSLSLSSFSFLSLFFFLFLLLLVIISFSFFYFCFFFVFYFPTSSNTPHTRLSPILQMVCNKQQLRGT